MHRFKERVIKIATNLKVLFVKVGPFTFNWGSDSCDMLGSWLSTADLTSPPVASRIKYQLCWLKAPIKCSYKIFPNRWRNNGHILRNGWLITYNWWVLPITWGGNCLISSREGSSYSRYLGTLCHHSTQSCGHMDCFIENLIVSIIWTLYLT